MAYGINDVVTKRQSRFNFLCIIISVVLSLASVISYYSGVSNVLTGIVNIIVYPINSCANYVSGKILSAADYFGDIAELKEENLRLKTENNALIAEKAAAQAVKKENEQLYEYLELKRDFTRLDLVNSRIISKGSGNFLQTFTIDKGTIHGVKKNMPIISANGILGIVIEESPTTSRGITLISHNSSVGIYLPRSGATGILSGDYKLSVKGRCVIKGLSADTDVIVGDPVMTSGSGEIYPGDLSVGIVTDIIKDATTHTLTLEVMPTCDLVNEESVMVITDFERVYEKVSPQQ